MATSHWLVPSLLPCYMKSIREGPFVERVMEFGSPTTCLFCLSTVAGYLNSSVGYETHMPQSVDP